MPRNFIVYKKESGQTFVFDFDDSPVGPLLRQIGRYASDPEIDFTWYDAGAVCQKIRTIFSDNLQNL